MADTKRLWHLPPGVKDFLFEEARQRRKVERGLVAVLEEYGFQEIITPTWEYGAVFLQADRNGEAPEEENRLYRFIDRDGRYLALRSDFTAQIARIAASRFIGMEPPIRVYYSGKVFRAEALHAGKSREKWQVGFEILGARGIDADLETLRVAVEAFQRLVPDRVRIAVGHIGYFNGLIADSGLSRKQAGELKYLIERKDCEAVRQAATAFSLPDTVKRALEALPELHGEPEVLQKARKLVRNGGSRQALDHLEELWKKLRREGLAEQIFLDLSEVEGMGYYTGIMLKAFAQGAGREVGTGGRYDNLVARFGREMPAVGFSFDVDLLVEAGNSDAMQGNDKQ